MDGSQHWASDRQSSVSDSLSHFPFFFHFVRCSCPLTTSSASSPRGKSTATQPDRLVVKIHLEQNHVAQFADCVIHQPLSNGLRFRSTT